MPLPWPFNTRLFWEIVVGVLLMVVMVTQMHRLDRYRGMVAESQVQAQLTALNQDVQTHQAEAAHYRDQAAQQDQTIQIFAKMLEQVQQRRPKLQEVAQRVQAQTATDEGLLQQAHTVLPDVAVRLTSDCRFAHAN